MFPTIQSMLKRGPPPTHEGKRRRTAPVTLCMAPTRELVSQIFDEARKCPAAGARTELTGTLDSTGFSTFFARPEGLAQKVELGAKYFMIQASGGRQPGTSSTGPKK